tara:strand:+ start:414 stop:1022 length:609 start_codon:yes stop_codon:yes gene_type:complete
MGLISNGTTLLDAGATSSGVFSGNMVLLATTTLTSNAGVIDFTNPAMSSTYKEYVFKIINIHPENDDVTFGFQVETGTGTQYTTATTSTMFRATHGEDGSSGGLAYLTSGDLADNTGLKPLASSVGNDADQCVSGELCIYEPSSTTFVKHFTGTFNSIAHSNRTNLQFPAGYFDITTALTRVRFKFSGGDIGSGTIKMYGIV